MYTKDFDRWNELKKQTNDKAPQITIRAGDIRWVVLGVNVGSEIDGKGTLFLRPALILHVIGSNLALIVPTTSKQKTIPGYLPFSLKNRNGSLCIHQLKVVSQNRILHRLERISDTRLATVRHAVVSFFNLTSAAAYMPHIHDLIDFTVTCMILHPTETKILLIHHKRLDMWLPPGGHIELNENPDQALVREVQEECGLPIEILSRKHAGEYGADQPLYLPDTVDMHPFGDLAHHHVNFGYYARALSADAKLESEAAHDIKWFSLEELRDPALNIKPLMRDYCVEFLEKFSRSRK